MTTEDINLINEKLNNITTIITIQFKEVKDRLDKQKARVNKHDEQISEALIERAANRMEQKAACKEIVRHEQELNEIKNTLKDISFFARHPKLFIAVLVAVTLLTLGSFLQTSPFKTFNPTLPAQTEQTK